MEVSSSHESVTFRPGGIIPVGAIDDGYDELDWLTSATLSIVVLGASGDLAKKKTYPSLLDLYDDNLLPKKFKIWGFARSKLTDDDLRDHLRPFLQKTDHSHEVVERFLKHCFYQGGKSYGDADAFVNMAQGMEEFETKYNDQKKFNRLFYFAIPPNVFADTAVAIKQNCMQVESKGWTRLIVEKPFGRDTDSFEKLNKTLSEHFTEDHLYRIDHYLGKELVQASAILRFGNRFIEKVWNSDNIQCVMLTFKEPFGTEGRGGYFDQYGIIRDILQNHLLQVLTLLAMEPPTKLKGPGAGKAIRDAKVAVLNAIEPIKIEDVVLGQYEGYSDDPTISNKDTNTPTFATLCLKVNTPRWDGVPFIMKAGKALNERKAEIRIQFKDPPAASFLFQGDPVPRNELVIRMQPHEAIYMKTNVKSPGFTAKPIQSELEVNYDTRFFARQREANPDAYTRLILDVLQGKHASFVRDDELRRAWQIFTPLLHTIEHENIKPIIYKKNGRGPIESDHFIATKGGYVRNEDYVFYEGSVARKTEGTNVTPAVIAASPPEKVQLDKLCDIGVFGLAVMGQNFALNIAQHGFKVCVGNRTPGKIHDTVRRAEKEGNLPICGAESPEQLIAHLKKPRKVIVLVQAGSPVDDAISTLARYMEPGDILIDGGDEWFHNSARRARFLEPKGIHFIGMGISGGEQGARHGPSLMSGGSEGAYKLVEPILNKCAAQVEGVGPCAGFLGPAGAGHYVKTVHNGIEYGDMQLIAEVYDVMKNALRMSNEEMADTFGEWNQGEMASYLLEITSIILRKKDEEEGYVVDHIVDKVGMKGTGKWTIQEGADKGVPVPTIAAALEARMLSARIEERDAASNILHGPAIEEVDKKQMLNDLREALYVSQVCTLAQGLRLIKAASDSHKWKIDLSECVRLWMGGCIIRSALLHKARDAFIENSNLLNLMLDPGFAKKMNEGSGAWRRVVAMCVTSGIACPSLCSSLNYYDTYRRNRLPANLTQAQRDFFGGHSYERIGKEGRFHTEWTESHMNIADAGERTAGEE